MAVHEEVTLTAPLAADQEARRAERRRALSRMTKLRLIRLCHAGVTTPGGRRRVIAAGRQRGLRMGAASAVQQDRGQDTAGLARLDIAGQARSGSPGPAAATAPSGAGSHSRCRRGRPAVPRPSAITSAWQA